MKAYVFRNLLLFFIVLSTLSYGCASFPGKELPVYTKDQITVPEKKITSGFDVEAFTPHGKNKKLEATLEKEIQRVLVDSGVFSDVALNKSDGDYRLSFVLRDEGNEALAFLSGFISGLSFTVIPGYARDNYVLVIDVKQDDKVIKTYTYRDHMNTWIQALLIVASPFNWPPNTVQSILDNMIMNFAHDFSNDIKSGSYIVQAK